MGWGRLHRDVDFKAVLPGVARSRDEGSCAVHLPVGEPVVLKRGEVHLGELLEHGFGLGSLDGQLDIGIAAVQDVHLPLFVFPNPLEILVLVGCVNANENVFRIDPVKDNVVR